MAASIIITSSPLFLIHHHHPSSSSSNPINKKTSKRVLMLAKRDSHNTSSSSLIQVGSPNNIQKVFEDKSRGIVCYMDDKGEITCEGFDEGPRLHQGLNSTFSSSSQRVDQDIIDLLKRSLLQVTDGGKVN